MNKQEKIQNFDPNSVGDVNANMFGLPFTTDESETVLIPVPWEVTVSYGGGTMDGPQQIFDASFQVDLYDPIVKDAWKMGIAMDDINEGLSDKCEIYRPVAEIIIDRQSNGEPVSEISEIKDVNKVCEEMNAWVKQRVLHFLKQKKSVGLIGGDHSTPLGMIDALSEHYTDFAILQIDAHADLRVAYEGFEYSHASIMYNALQIPQISKIVQVGIRDFCEQEVAIALKDRVLVHTDSDLKCETFEGKTWQQQCDQIIASLPEKVCISFDIDGMYPWYCPNTGTPVPGGFSFEQAAYLFSRLAETNKEIIGFDLVEVAPGDDDWDGNVGARMLFHMCGAFAKSQKMNVGKKIQFNK